MRTAIRYITIVILLAWPVTQFQALSAGPGQLIPLAKSQMSKGDYYGAITECMRYRYCYPGGAEYPLSMLIQGEAYYRGGNYAEATRITAECFERYKQRREGEQALINLGHMRLMSGSPFFAFRTYQEYLYLYPGGQFREEATLDMCRAIALEGDLAGARARLDGYARTYPDGRYLENVRELQYLIDSEINRPKKSLAVSILGSLFIPGFGHFYTGRYTTGIFTLASNAALLFLIYDGYRDDNTFRMVFFSLAEISLYQYSLYAAVRNVYEYNSRDEFYRAVRLAIRKNF